MTVSIISFEIIDLGLATAEAFQTQKDAARQALLDFAIALGAEAYRPNSRGNFYSALFAGELPKGWRKIGGHNGHMEAMPHRGTKIGKQLIHQIERLPKIPNASELAHSLGYKTSLMPTADGKIYFPTELRVEFPKARHFLTLPLTASDEFIPNPKLLRELRESEFMRAIEDHNAEARRQEEDA